MAGLYNRFQHFPRHHVAVSPSNDADLPQESMIFVDTSGTVAVHDSWGRAKTYTVVAGDILPVIVKRVLATGTTSTVTALY